MAPVTVTVTSFGYGHAPAPEADITLDVRASLRNPHDDPAMRYLTGLDEAVRGHVLATKGAIDLVRGAAVLVEVLLYSCEAARPVTVAFGCAGGRHRSVVLAVELAEELAPALRIPVEVSHRDVDKPVIQR